MGSRKIPVTLVCAAADEQALEPVRDRLRAAGQLVELVAGVDEQPRRVGDVLDRLGPRGVVVACTGRALDGPALRKLEGVFGARRGPHHALVRVELNQDPGELAAAIQRAVEAFAAKSGRLVRAPSREPSSPMREVIQVGDLAGVTVPGRPSRSGREGRERGASRSEASSGSRAEPRPASASERGPASSAERGSVSPVEASREPVAARAPAPEPAAGPDEAGPEGPPLTAAARQDRIMLAILIGTGLVAVLAALSLSGVL